MPPADYRGYVLALVATTVAATAFFALFPEADLAVSGWFYAKDGGFWLGESAAIQHLRDGIWNVSIAAFALSIAGLLCAVARRPLPGLGAREAGFIFLLYLLGPILLVNGVLKAHWGRARPADVVEFGGTAAFTPPWLPTDQCLTNCSFVSGEGSAAAALAVTFLILAPASRRLLPSAAYAVYVTAGFVLPAAGVALRVLTGRHFLSDTVFAVLLVLALALGLHRLLLSDR